MSGGEWGLGDGWAPHYSSLPSIPDFHPRAEAGGCHKTRQVGDEMIGACLRKREGGGGEGGKGGRDNASSCRLAGSSRPPHSPAHQVYDLIQSELLSSPGYDVIVDIGDSLWRTPTLKLPRGTCYECQVGW